MKTFISTLIALLILAMPIQVISSQIAEQNPNFELIVSNFYNSLNNHAKLKSNEEIRISKIRIKEQFLTTSATLFNDLSTSGSSIYDSDTYIDNIKIIYPYEDNPLHYEVSIIGISTLIDIESSSRKYCYVLYNITLKGKQNNRKIINKELALKAQLFIDVGDEPKIGNISLLTDKEKIDLLKIPEVKVSKIENDNPIVNKQVDTTNKPDEISKTTTSKNAVISDKYDYKGKFSEGLVAVAKNCKWGYINENGIEIIPLKYEHATEFSEGKAAVKLKGQYGYINKKDETVIDYKYTFAFPFEEGSARIGIYGIGDFLIDVNGKVISPDERGLSIGEFHDGLAKIKGTQISSSSGGYIDRKGKVAIKRVYRFVGDFSNGTSFVTQNGIVFIINTKGKTIKKVENLLLQEERAYLRLDEKKDILNFTINKQDGYVDKLGKVKMYPTHKFDLLYWFSNGIAKVKKNNKFGFVNENYEEIIPIVYEDAKRFSEGVAAVKKNDLWGFIDLKGNTVINFQFTDANEFSENRCFVRMQDKSYGFIDGNGKLVFKFNEWPKGYLQYKDGIVDLYNGLILNKDGKCLENCHLVDCPQRITNEDKDNNERPEGVILNFFSLINNLIDPQIEIQDKEVFKSELLEGYLNKENSLLNNLFTKNPTIFLNGSQFIAAVTNQLDVVNYSVNNLKIVGPFDINYEVKNKQELYAISFGLELTKNNDLKEFRNIYAHVVKKEIGSDYIKLLTIADFPTDKKIKEKELESAHKSKIFKKTIDLGKKLGSSYVEFMFNDIYSYNLNGKIGFVDSVGKILIAPQFDMVTKISNDLISVRENKKYGILTKELKQLTLNIYDDIGGANSQYIVVGKKSGEKKVFSDFGMIDRMGQEVLPLKYWKLKPFEDGMAVFGVYKSYPTLYGFINMQGNVIIDPQFKEAYSFYKGYAAVQSGGGKEYDDKWGFIDKTGTMTINFQYDYIFNLEEGYYLAKLDGKYGYLDYKGEIVLPFIYTEAFPFQNGFACVRMDNDDFVGIINQRGETVLPFVFKKVFGIIYPVNAHVLNEIQSFKFEDLNPQK